MPITYSLNVTQGLLAALATIALIFASLTAHAAITGTIAADFYLVEDAAAEYSAQDMLAEKHRGEFHKILRNRVSAEKSGAALWLKFSVPKSVEKTQQRVLVVGPAYVDELVLYATASPNKVSENGIASGDAIPFFSKPYPNRLHVFELGPEENTYYLRATSQGILNLSWKLSTEEAFLQSDRIESFGYAILLGILLTMILFNTGIFMAIGDKTYVYYVLYHIFAAIMIYSLAGYGSQFVWPNYSNSTNISIPASVTGMCFFGVLFVRSFLDLPRLLPRYAQLLERTAMLVAILAIPGLLLPYTIGSRFTYGGAFIVLIAIAIAVINARKEGIATARYLTMTFGFAVLPGSLGEFGYAFGWLPENMFFANMLEITTVTETLLLSLFMAYRIKVSETEKLQAQQKNIDLQRSFNERMLDKQEEERGRIARELHDSVGPNLSALRIHLQSSEDAGDMQAAAPMMSNTQTLELLKATINEVRQLSHNLHPSQLDRLSLTNALVMFTRQFNGKDMPAFKVQMEVQEQQIPEEKKIHLYRIAQEAIQNVINHAQASHCYVSLSAVENKISLSIRDNGRGFVSDSQHGSGLGMTSMADRANIMDATLNVDSQPGEGTQITVTLTTSDT